MVAVTPRRVFSHYVIGHYFFAFLAPRLLPDTINSKPVIDEAGIIGFTISAEAMSTDPSTGFEIIVPGRLDSLRE